MRCPETPSLVMSLALVLISSCDSSPSDLKTWTPQDHGHTSQPSAGQVAAEPTANPLMARGIDEVAIVAWKQNCATCHGMVGRGDGPQAPMVQPPDLGDPSFHQKISDEQIAAVILGGKGKMPAFNLPPTTVDGLVKLVRLMGGQPQTAPLQDAGADAQAGDASNAPSPKPASGDEEGAGGASDNTQ